MEGNYQPGFYSTERDQQESEHQHSLPPPQQQQQRQQQQQQHAAHYPLDLPIPYYTTSQHQSEHIVDHPLRAFPIPQSTAPMLSSMYHDSGAVLPNSSIADHAHQQVPFSGGGHGVKSSVNHAAPITTHGPAVERNIPPITTLEPVGERNILPSTTPEPVVEENIPITTTRETAVRIESDIHPITIHKVDPNSNATRPKGIALYVASSKQLQDNNQREQSSPSSHLTCESPPAPSTSSEEPPLFAALNLKKTNSIQDLPSSLSCRVTSRDKVQGVVAKETIEKGVEFGPYTGTLMDENLGWSKETTWEICVSGRVYHYIDGCKYWMSHLRCAQSEEEQNMEAYQYYGEIYFRSTKVIEPGSELKVFYSEEYGKRVGIKTRLQELKFNQDAQKFQCSQCEGLFTSAKLVLRHIRCEHIKGKPKEMRRVMTQNKRKKKSVGIDVGSNASKQQITTKRRARNRKGSVFKCATCEKVFPSCGRLKAHEIFHEYNQDHTCPVCGKRQKNAQTWAKHMMTHKPVQEARPHKCNECNGRYQSKAALRKHEHQIHGYPCRLCSERFSRKQDCTKHEKTHQVFIPTRDAEEYFVAEAGPDEPKDMLGKSAHYYQLPFKCRYCPKRYSSHKTAKVHEKETHTGEGTFKCTHCPKIFTCESRLKVHLLVHQQTNIYRCTLCPKGFASESALNSHQGEHTGLKPFKCDVCDRGFRTRKLVLAHRRRVHQERPKRYFCSFCNRGFTERGDLKKHEDRHKGIRRYSCMQCGKLFTSNTSLTAHIRALHTKERPFACDICGKTFTLNFKYTLHMVRHNFQQAEGSSTQQ